MTSSHPSPGGESSKSSDRELLELAAKAAGMNTLDAMWHPRAGFVWVSRSTGIRKEHGWNPLVDDGDALRLAAKLRIRIVYFLADVEARHDHTEPVFELFSEHADEYASTRHAIVRVAAALGASS